MSQILKCCVCNEEINLNTEAEFYPCALGKDKTKWVCSEFCWAIADAEGLNEISPTENKDDEVLEIIENLEEVEPEADDSQADNEDGEDIEEVTIE